MLGSNCFVIGLSFGLEKVTTQVPAPAGGFVITELTNTSESPTVSWVRRRVASLGVGTWSVVWFWIAFASALSGETVFFGETLVVFSGVLIMVEGVLLWNGHH